jgi:hypothetical protein
MAQQNVKWITTGCVCCHMSLVAILLWSTCAHMGLGCLLYYVLVLCMCMRASTRLLVASARDSYPRITAKDQNGISPGCVAGRARERC